MAAVSAAIILAIGAGLIVRPFEAGELIVRATVAAGLPNIVTKLPETEVASDCPVDKRNSIAMRKALVIEALAMIPKAGLVGIGLDGFENASCLHTYPHNLFLQAMVEFGIASMVILVVLLWLSFKSLLPLIRKEPVALFVFGGLVFILFESVFSGALTGSALLFGFMGWAVGMRGDS